MNLIPISTLSDPRLAPYANMRDAELAQRTDPLDAAAHGGLFIAEGELVVGRLIASRFRVQSVLTTESRLETLRDALAPLPPETPVFVADQPTMNQIVGFNMHRGVLAIGVRGPSLTLPALLERGGPVIILEDLTNHDNLGGVFRNAAALGGTGVSVVLSPRCADPLYRKSIRVSMGAALCVPFLRASVWPDVLREIAGAGYQVWGFALGDGSDDLGAACRSVAANPAPVAMLFGSEGPGLTPEALAACTRRVRIPMRKAAASIDSLNVAMASGIALNYLGDIARTNV